ncbi:unnamed protein product [Tilletia controversa]|uniref:Myb-like domain-containing protein n=3 Tax=Tilletia TaxID=13289 RepID=A0A8X7MTA5_9BASI|nr:hypothetical protein CF336_g5749 [Tilletia laevis]KAE8192319.1 hypothetical protein CF328_g5406 [Tilletia controversa]KAE8256793.1 hypothetical protein A4X03_0g5055 [Tilletia caries]KAE8195401.1 hypothetical protein CF335_g5104 [Tilletia laevis]KAE8247162.1 hypothetical protein A4X06_0g4656 [Tilletia controversa]
MDPLQPFAFDQSEEIRNQNASMSSTAHFNAAAFIDTTMPASQSSHTLSRSNSITPPSSVCNQHPFHKHFWSEDETNALVEGCNKHGIGNWKAMLLDKDIAHRFADRTAGDLKDRFRTYFPDTYHEVYPNAKTHHSHRVRGKDSAGHSIFQKVKTNQRRPFSPAEDDAIKRGYEKHGSHWSVIARDPVFSGLRRATDLRDRFRNAFPAEYEKAGYKPRPKPKRERRPSANNVPSAPESLAGYDTAANQFGSSSDGTGAGPAVGGLQRSFSSKRATPKVSNFDLTPSSETEAAEVSAMNGILARSFSGSFPMAERSVLPLTATPAMVPQPAYFPRAQSAIDGHSPLRPTIWSSAMDAFLDPVQDLLDPVVPTSSMWNPFLSGFNGTPNMSTSVAPSHHPFAGDLHHHSVTNFSLDDLPKFIDMGSMNLPPLLSNWLDGSATAGPSNPTNNTSMIVGPASSAPTHPGRSVSDGQTTTLSSAPSIADPNDPAVGGTEMSRPSSSDHHMNHHHHPEAFAHFANIHSAPSMGTFNTGSPTASPYW